MPLPALPFPAIDPVLIELGPLAIRWYSLAYIAGLLFAWWYVKRLIRNNHLWADGPRPSPLQIDDVMIWIVLGVILGGRIGYVLAYNPAYFFANPATIFAIWEGGMSFHGGAAGVILAMTLYGWRHKISILSLLDLAAASVPVGLFFGRLANFINGELYGRVSDVPWAFVFPGGGPEPRHPSQLYEAALEGIVLFLVLRYLTHRRFLLKQPGLVGAAFLVGYGTARIIVEFFRMPDPQIGFLAGGLTMGMALSAPMVLAGLIAAYLITRRAA